MSVKPDDDLPDSAVIELQSDHDRLEASRALWERCAETRRASLATLRRTEQLLTYLDYDEERLRRLRACLNRLDESPMKTDVVDIETYRRRR